jgi:YedE family putative selenium metabolism protein
MSRDTLWVIIAGAALGVAAVILVLLGNPGNMGFCIACFQRDITGALGLFNWNASGSIQYLRPEIIGIVLGAFITALIYREFRPQGGSAPATRFLLGFFMMLGALAFLGCPTRMVLRLAGGDLNALVALVGFALGIAVGVWFLRSGYVLGRAQRQGVLDGIVLPGFMVLLLIFLVVKPVFAEGGPVFISATGHPGGEGSPVSLALGITISLAAGLVVGYFGQRSRLCFAGGIRDLILMRSGHLLSGVIAVFVVVLVGNLILGNFHLGFADQPVAHTAHAWNFLGMALVGLAATLLGGCPFRQTVLAGSGNTDSALTVFGMLAGAAFAHNFALVKAATLQGKAAVILGLVILIVIAFINRKK